MASRYWFGGTGTWDTTTTTNWSAASALSFTASRSGTTLTTVGSPALVIGMTVRDATNTSIGTITGGSGNTWTMNTSGTVASQTMKAATAGAAVPTAADSVFFDANSSGTAAYTVTMTGAILCLDITVSALTPTFATGTSPTLAVSGSMTLAAGMTWNATGAITFNATTTGKTITTNGVSIPANMTLNGVGGAWTLGSALSNTGSTGLTLTNGTFSTGNYAMTLSGLASSNSNTRSMSLGSSTITITTNSFNFSLVTNLTFNAGTSTISFTATAASLNYSTGLTFYNVSLSGNPSFSLTYGLNGSATFNTLTIPSGLSSTLQSFVTFSSNNTVSTLAVGGQTNPYSRLYIQSSVAGSARTLTVGAVSGTLSDADFADIAFAGAAAPLTGTRLGDLGGNSGITFSAPKNVYWVSAGSQSWYAASWALTAGGAATVNAFPLAQDTAVIGASQPSSGSTITFDTNLPLPAIDLSARTASLVTLQTNTAIGMNFYGDVTLASGVTLAVGTAVSYNYLKRGTQNLVFAGRSIPSTVTHYISAYGGTVVLNDNLTFGSVALNSGTLNLNGYNLTVPSSWSDGGSLPRGISFGVVAINLSGSGLVFSMTTGSNFSYSGTGAFNVTNATATATSVIFPASGVTDSNALNFNFTAGTYALTFTSGRYVGGLNFTGFSGSVANVAMYILGNLTMSATASYAVGTSAWTLTGTSGTKIVTSGGVTYNFPINFGILGGSAVWRLADAMTLSSLKGVTLIDGTLDLNGKTLTCGSFTGSGPTARTIAFGTGNITVNGTGTVVNNATTTNLTVTGTPVINVSNSSATATTVSSGSSTESNSISFNFTTGTYALTFLAAGGSTARDINFTGFFGTLNAIGTLATCFGSMTLSSGMNIVTAASVLTFGATSGTKTLTSNGKTFPAVLAVDGVGGTLQLQDALNLSSVNSVTLTNGTLDLNGKTMTVGPTGNFATGAGTKNLTFNGGTLAILAATATAFNNANPTGFTTTAGTGTGTISMTAATAKTFVGGGSTYNCTLNQGGAGTLTISGANTFTNITNTVVPATVLFTAGTTTTFNNFNLNGTVGNLVTIASATAATHTLSKASGTVSCDYLSITNSTATGGATWYAGAHSTNVSNNTGWIFTAPPGGSGNFFTFLTN